MCTDMRLQEQTGISALQAQSKPPALPVVVIYVRLDIIVIAAAPFYSGREARRKDDLRDVDKSQISVDKAVDK